MVCRIMTSPINIGNTRGADQNETGVQKTLMKPIPHSRAMFVPGLGVNYPFYRVCNGSISGESIRTARVIKVQNLRRYMHTIG